MPIIVVIDIPIKEEDREKALDSFKSYIELTRAEEGNICCHVYEDMEKRNTFHKYEEFTSLEALDTHRETSQFKDFLVVMASMASGPPVMRKYDAANVPNAF
jgi:quinol monooxygenase YgiN